MRSLQIGLFLTLSIAALAAETVTLRDGRVITGTCLGGSAREVRVGIGDQIRSLDIVDSASIQFGAAGTREERTTRPAASADGLTLPAGTKLVIR
jgi:hypothetical protein